MRSKLTERILVGGGVLALASVAIGGAMPGLGTDAYVREGMLAVWDGIENAGSTRQHDSSAAVWKDVIGDRAFALTGVSIEDDGLVFSGAGADSRGVLSADDAATSFAKAGNGTMEIVLIPDTATGQRVAMQGPSVDGAGISIGIASVNAIFFHNTVSLLGIDYNWRGEANTFSAMYADSKVCTDYQSIFRNGELVPSSFYRRADYWGSPDLCAYVGGRCSGADGFVGKICCIRLYDRHLTAAEVAANAEVDRIRYRERPVASQVIVAGDPAEYGSPSPAYGTLTPSAGAPTAFSAGETVVESTGMKMRCVGHRVLRATVGGGWSQEGEDSAETSFSYAHDGTVARKVEWIWKGLAVATPEVVSARRLSAEFGIRVDRVGFGELGVRLSLVWGTSAQLLDQTNVVATVAEPGDCRAHLTRTKQCDYYVQAVLEELDEDGATASAVTSDVVLLPADRIEDDRTREYVNDGLVAWWDGIYNGGSGRTFERSPLVWNDVVGNVPFSVQGYAPSATGDSMEFPGEAGVYGVMTEENTAKTFGRCSNGTLEIVARGNRQDRACIALRASDASGIAFGSYCRNNQLYFYLTASATPSAPTLRCSWEDRRTFAVRYDQALHQDAMIDGRSVELTRDVQDYWGNAGDGSRAYVGNRSGATGQLAMDGEICAIRLYNRRLTDQEAAQNSRIDDNRFRGRLAHDCLEVTGAPYEYGIVSPAYGLYCELTRGEQIVCTAPAEIREGKIAATCTGWQLQTNAVGDASVWLPWCSGEGTECAYENSGAPARLVWQWQVSGGSPAGLGEVVVYGVRTDAANVIVPVLGLGSAEEGTLTLRWGCAPDALANVVSRTVSGAGEVEFGLDGLLPGRRYFAQATLTAEGVEAVASDVVMCETPEGADPEGTRELLLAKGMAYVSSVVADGRPGDGVTVTGKVDFPSAADDIDWFLRVREAGEPVLFLLAADDVTVDADGNFSLTVVTDNPDAENYIRPGRQYALAVETVRRGGGVSASAVCAFDTLTSASIDVNSLKATSNARTLTVGGRMMDVGAGGAATLTLMVGEDAESLADVDVATVTVSNPSFAFDHTVPKVGCAYWWAIRCVNEADGRTVSWTNSLPARLILADDAAHYEWTGSAESGLWSDKGNWRAQQSSDNPTPVAAEDCVGYPCMPSASVSFPEGQTVAVDVDVDVRCRNIQLNKPRSKVTVTSSAARTLTLDRGILVSAKSPADEPSVLVLDGIEVDASGATLEIGGDGAQMILRNGTQIECELCCMRFDNGVFNGGTGTNLTVVGAGCKIKAVRNVFLASGATCVVSNGTLEVGGNLLFNCETDGGTLRLAGDRPHVTVGGDCRSTNEPRQLSGSGGIVFDIPVGGYQSVPIVLQSAVSSFGGTDDMACQPLHLSVVKRCGAYRMPKTCVYPLLSTVGTINLSRQVFGELKRTPTSAFVYAEVGDEPAWLTKDELSPEAAPQLFGVRLGGAGGLMILLR